MPGNSPEQQCQSCDTDCDEDADPYGAAEQELLHIRLADAQRAERCRFRLSQKNEDWVQLVLVTDEEKDSQC